MLSYLSKQMLAAGKLGDEKHELAEHKLVNTKNGWSMESYRRSKNYLSTNW